MLESKNHWQIQVSSGVLDLTFAIRECAAMGVANVKSTPLLLGTAILWSSKLSVAFTKEESAETAAETLLPDRPISPHPNLVTEAGLKALELKLQQAREAHDAAQQIDDVNERRRQAAIPLRDIRYFSERVRTAQVIPDPKSSDVVAFGSTVTFSRNDGRVQKYRIVGEDEADPKAGSISFASPVAKSLMGKVVGDTAGSGSQELEIVAIS